MLAVGRDDASMQCWPIHYQHPTLFWFGKHLFFYAGSSAEYISEGRRGGRSHNPRDAKKVAGSVIYPCFGLAFFAPAPSDVRIKTPPAILQLHTIFARLDPEPDLKGTVQDFACQASTGKKKEKPWVESIGATQSYFNILPVSRRFAG